ncbi:hypothetical protein OUZ56_000176 [Daphnia magna]|uniref:Uncharacterized protein n=1 Tax=Daphnia magna TaxID=35525 RepID=A0ABQ9ZYX6_9CRUS|nr:hypothetical protein OUZ56_000176 [Daphnia magna]
MYLGRLGTQSSMTQHHESARPKGNDLSTVVVVFFGKSVATPIDVWHRYRTLLSRQQDISCHQTKKKFCFTIISGFQSKFGFSTRCIAHKGGQVSVRKVRGKPDH